VRGPELVTVREFNRRHRSDGMGFLTEERTWMKKLLGQRGRVLRVPFDRESEHLMTIGDSGGGKTSLLRQMLVQVEERGELAIVNDPAREYLRQFYDPSRGDLVLNPLDARMPYWNPSDEVRHPAEAEAIAESLFPDEPGEKKFFIHGPRGVFAHLLLLKATPEEIIWCLSHEEEIKRLVKGTLLESVLHPSADNQRAGVLGSLNLVAAALKLLPRKEETKSVWTAADWSEERRGWLFITSTPATRKALLPLMSLWLDMLVLRLINQGRSGRRRVWFVLDELATLQHLPQLHTAITENRKSNNPVVLGFHGRSQIERRYGLDAKAMVSSPATKFFLRTSEPDSAEWISAAIGDVVMARLRESRTRGHFPQEQESTSQQVDRSVERLVLPSEIGGLDDRQGYLKHRNLVVPISFPYLDLPERQPDLILRPVNIEPPGKLTLRAAAPPLLPPLTREPAPAAGNDGEAPEPHVRAMPRPKPPPPREQESQAHEPRARKRFRDF
jgi:type IV secretory pathway TraG/TraD family ATPase VirD4